MQRFGMTGDVIVDAGAIRLEQRSRVRVEPVGGAARGDDAMNSTAMQQAAIDGMRIRSLRGCDYTPTVGEGPEKNPEVQRPTGPILITITWHAGCEELESSEKRVRWCIFSPPED